MCLVRNPDSGSLSTKVVCRGIVIIVYITITSIMFEISSVINVVHIM